MASLKSTDLGISVVVRTGLSWFSSRQRAVDNARWCVMVVDRQSNSSKLLPIEISIHNLSCLSYVVSDSDLLVENLHFCPPRSYLNWKHSQRQFPWYPRCEVGNKNLESTSYIPVAENRVIPRLLLMLWLNAIVWQTDRRTDRLHYTTQLGVTAETTM